MDITPIDQFVFIMRLVFCIAFSWFIFLTITSVRAQIGAGPLASKAYAVGLDVGYNKSTIFGSYVDYFLEDTPAQGWEKSEVISKNATEVDFTISRGIYRYLYLKSGLGYTQHAGKIAHTRLTYPIDVTLEYMSVPLGVGINPAYKGVSLAAEGGLLGNFELRSTQDFQKGVWPGLRQTNHSFIPNFYWSGSALCSITSRWAIRASYRYVKALRPFYENGGGPGTGRGKRQYLPKRAHFSGGIVYALK